jgi:hypothetical protein
MRRIGDKRKGEAAPSASAAGALIAIIAALIVLYILFVPPAEREKILEGTGGDYVTSEEEGGNTTLFELKEPRMFLPETEKKFERIFPSVTLYITEEGNVLKKVDSVYARKSLFSEDIGNIDFKVDDKEHTKNILLNFAIKEGKGRLTVRINGNTVFDKEAAAGNIEPIKLDDYVKEGINTVLFSVSSPGALFWATNKYSLEEVSVTADLLRTEAQESTVKFILTKAEKENIEKVMLRFFPSCTLGTVGKLDISLNGLSVYSSVPDCGTPSVPAEFSPNYLVSGENTLKFSTTKGRYLLEQIKLSADMKKVEMPVYYFQLTSEQIGKIADEDANVTLSMKFVDDVETKNTDIRLNGKLILVNQKEMTFSKNINDFVEKGNNALKLEPIDALEVVEMKVVLAES